MVPVEPDSNPRVVRQSAQLLSHILYPSFYFLLFSFFFFPTSSSFLPSSHSPPHNFTMASSTVIPTFSNPCIASFVTPGSTQVYLAGVSDVSNGLLEVYVIDIANIQTPVSARVVSNPNALYWKSTAPKACSTYPGDTSATTAALHFQQFGPFTSYDSNILTSGVVETPSRFDTYSWVSPKNYAIVGNAGPIAFVAALTNQTTLATNSPWVGVRLNGTSGIDGTMK